MARQAISVNAVFVGLSALIPIPFLDEAVRKVFMRGAYQAIAEGQGERLSPETLDQLTRGGGLSALGCVFGLVWSIVKRVSKKILYFLTIKDSLDWTAEAAVRGEMVRQALDRGLLPGRAPQVKVAMDRAWEAHGGSPVTRTLLFQRDEALDWQASEGALVPVVGALARRGAAARVIAAFHEELDRPAVEPRAAEGEGTDASGAPRGARHSEDEPGG